LCRPRTTAGLATPASVTSTAPTWPSSEQPWLGEHAIQGFRNTDLTRRLYSPRPRDREEARRRCERTSRLIVKLRGHGLVAKIPRARRYRVTPYGQRVMTAAVALHDNRFADNYNAAA
jgi:hypothetical protein